METWAAVSFPVKPLHLESKQPPVPITTNVFSAVRRQPVYAKQARQIQLGGLISHIGLDGLEQSGVTGQRHHGVDPVEYGDGLGSGGGTVFVPAQVIWKPTPIYTEEARDDKTEGEVVVDAEFSVDGTVRVLRFVQRLGHGLDEIAVEAIEAITFKPASVNGKPVSVQARAHIEFHLF
jgi:TonB family protein